MQWYCCIIYLYIMMQLWDPAFFAIYLLGFFTIYSPCCVTFDPCFNHALVAFWSLFCVHGNPLLTPFITSQNLDFHEFCVLRHALFASKPSEKFYHLIKTLDVDARYMHFVHIRINMGFFLSTKMWVTCVWD